MIIQTEIKLTAKSRGFHLITNEIIREIKLPETGILNLFIQHTSAGLTINENADSSVRIDFEQIFNKLKRKGLIKSVRGPKGGYVFNRHPQDVSVYDVAEALEEDLSIVKGFEGASSEVWDEVARRIKETLQCFSFQDLAMKNAELVYEENLLGQ